MRVTLADSIVQVDGWLPELDVIGEYKLKVRKTPAELRAERELLRQRGKTYKPSNIRLLPRTVIEHEEPDTAYFLPGLWPRVKGELDARGIRYELIDKRNMDIRPELDMSAFCGVEFRGNQAEAIATIANEDCGIIDSPTGSGKSFIVSMLCKAYPTLNIVITTSSAQVVATLYQYLCKQIPGEVGVKYANRDTTAGKRVVVVTLASLSNINPENVHLVLVDECHNVGHNVAGDELMKFCWARRFGFSASPVRNSGDGLMMEALLGPVIFKVDYQDAVDNGMVTPIKYLMLKCNDCPPAAKNPELPDVTMKRLAYWSNRSRNMVIRDFVYRLKQVYDGQVLIYVGGLRP